MLLGKYILFSAALIVMVMLALTFTVKRMTAPAPNKQMDRILEAFDGITRDQYDTVDVSEYLGERGYVQILDDKLNVIYSSDPARMTSAYTEREIELISGGSEEVIVSISEIKDDERGSVAEVSVTHHDIETGTRKNELYVIDDDGNVLYSSRKEIGSRVSDRELSLIENAVSRRYSVSKYSFVDMEGNEKLLIGYIPQDFKYSMRRIYDIYISVIWKFAVAYIILVIVFSLWISRKVKSPMEMVQSAMDGIAAGDRGTVINYSGPQEFVEICDKFNDMSLKLEAYEKENASLQQKKQRLVSNISHDLKTPITVIKGYSKAVLDGVAEPGDEIRYITAINEKAEYMSDLINEFSEYALADDPDNAYDFKRTDICEYMREVFASKYDEFEIGDRIPVIDIPEEEIFVNLDGKKFYRACNNIFSNFFKYTPSGTTMFCKIYKDEERVYISLGDNGNGIPEEFKEDIFDPFVTGDASRSGTGTGLGLAFVKKVIDVHGGTIELKQPPDPGLNFQFLIALNLINES